MAGLIEEGQEVIEEASEKDDVAADLSLIAAAQKVEHYEMSGYLSAKSLATRAGQTEAATLLGQSLLEEERADKILNRLACELMDEAALLEEGEADEADEAEEEDSDEAEGEEAMAVAESETETKEQARSSRRAPKKKSSR